MAIKTNNRIDKCQSCGMHLSLFKTTFEDRGIAVFLCGSQSTIVDVSGVEAITRHEQTAGCVQIQSQNLKIEKLYHLCEEVMSNLETRYEGKKDEYKETLNGIVA